MNKQQKELVIKTLKEGFDASSASFLVGVKSLSVSQTQALRSELRKNGGHLKVAKVRLMRRAIDEVSGAQGLKPFLREQIGIVFVDKANPAVAKVLHDFAKENTALELVASLFESQIFDKDGVKRLAALPSREVLLARLCGSLNAPMAKLASVLDARAKQLAEQASGQAE